MLFLLTVFIIYFLMVAMYILCQTAHVILHCHILHLFLIDVDVFKNNLQLNQKVSTNLKIASGRAVVRFTSQIHGLRWPVKDKVGRSDEFASTWSLRWKWMEVGLRQQIVPHHVCTVYYRQFWDSWSTSAAVLNVFQTLELQPYDKSV